MFTVMNRARWLGVKNTFFGFLLTLSFTIQCAPKLPDAITLSYISHPYLEKNILPLIEKVYGDIGIRVDFVLQPSQRNMFLASSGQTDGEVAYSELLINEHDNLIKVGKSIVDSRFTLICHDSVQCEVSVLNNREITLLITEASLGGVKRQYGQSFKATPYFISTLSNIPKIIEQKRLIYGVYVTVFGDTSLANYQHLKKQYLFSTATYHVLNSRLAHLAPLISERLDKFAPQFVPGYGVSVPE